jgi:rod shape-determining protein MreC
VLELFRSKFFIIGLIAACLLTVFAMASGLMGYVSPIAELGALMVYPFRQAGLLIYDGARGFVGYFEGYDRLRTENNALRTENEDLRTRMEDYSLLREEIDALYRFFELRQERFDFEFEHAKVIAREADGLRSVITVNRGAFHGIEVDMPAVSEHGLVGYISHVGMFTSNVTLFIRASAASVSATVRRSGESGMVEGDFRLERRGLSRLTYLPPDSDIEVGDRIYTSGLGSIYPWGIYVGEVVSVAADPYLRRPVAEIMPAVNFAELRSLMIITAHERRFD